MFLSCNKPKLPGYVYRSKLIQRGVRVFAQYPRLFCGFNRKVGRGLYGNRTVFTKGCSTRKSTFRSVFWPQAGFFSLGLIVTTVPLRPLFGLAYLVKSAVGSWFYTPAMGGVRSLCFVQATTCVDNFVMPLNPEFWWWSTVRSLPPYSSITIVAKSVISKAQFALSPFTRCILLIPRYVHDRSLIKLPSGQLCVIDQSVYVSRGENSIPSTSKSLSTTAGFWRALGWSPKVRGTVKNPNDHPNGGRTKALRYPKSPWGKTTKFPRKKTNK